MTNFKFKKKIGTGILAAAMALCALAPCTSLTADAATKSSTGTYTKVVGEATSTKGSSYGYNTSAATRYVYSSVYWFNDNGSSATSSGGAAVAKGGYVGSHKSRPSNYEKIKAKSQIHSGTSSAATVLEVKTVELSYK